VLSSHGETHGFACVALWLPDGDGPPLRCGASWVAPDAGPAVNAFASGSSRLRLAPGRGLPGRVFAFRRPSWVANVRADAQEPRAGAARHARLKAAVAVPLGQGEDPAGVLELFARDVREHDPETEAMLATVGGQIARALVRESATSLRDPLTGLPTAALLEEHVELALARARRSGASVLVLHLRLLAGPDLLAPLAMRVTDVLRATDVLARTGPSELGVLLADLRYAPADVIERVTGRLREALEEPLLLGGDEMRVEPVIGHAAFPQDSDDAAELMALAKDSAHALRARTAGSPAWTTESSSDPAPVSSDLRPVRSTQRSS
jgi:GGDEF domain-containing protein